MRPSLSSAIYVIRDMCVLVVKRVVAGPYMGDSIPDKDGCA